MSKLSTHKPFSYQVIKASTTDELEKEVIILMKRDWEPQGGVSCVQDEAKNTIVFYQAMVKSL